MLSTGEQRTFVRRVVAESARLAALAPRVDCLPFHWPYYDDDCDTATKPMFPGGRVPLPVALQTMALTESYEAGATGVILWVRHKGGGHRRLRACMVVSTAHMCTMIERQIFSLAGLREV